jgi:beta-aspartyl-peptidase (threonine type)
MNEQKIALAIHGGAGTILRANMTQEMEHNYKAALKAALEAGYQILKNKGSALDAVEAAVVSLENCPLFNAGKGSVFTAKGTHEMDASIMDGSNLNAGAVSMVTGIKNPIKAARLVMTHSGHVFLAGEGAIEFAKTMNCEFEPSDYFFDEFRHKQWLEIRDSDSFQLDHSTKKDEKFGTVGAVALDSHGNIAAATSTGGMTNKKYGRVGDSPMIGAGTYANNQLCAVSCTGSGEYFIRAVVAHDVAAHVEHKNMPLNEACHEVINKRLVQIGGDGGLIAINKQGDIAMTFNTEGMYRGAIDTQGNLIVEIYK